MRQLRFILQPNRENEPDGTSCQKGRLFPAEKHEKAEGKKLSRQQKIEQNPKEQRPLLQQLREQGAFLPADCGGKGHCGKCKVRVLEGTLPVTKKDLSVLTEQELAMGFRLACCAYPEGDLLLEIPEQAEASILSDFCGNAAVGFSKQGKTNGSGAVTEKAAAYAAIDLGTTTVVICLYRADGTLLGTKAFLNPQRSFGADVISRIQAANEGQEEQLTRGIREAIEANLTELLQDLCKQKLTESLQDLHGKNQPESQQTSAEYHLKQIVLAGNTTMIHLLMGYPCETLGVYPFTPVNLNLIRCPAQQLFCGSFEQAELIIFPGISTFVGGDIVAGLFAQNFAVQDETRLLVDLGTNGEMAIGNRNRLLVTSVAAGPAFEGGNISCGTGSVAGAVEDITLAGEKVLFCKTIFHQRPVGICGSGSLALTFELVKNGITEPGGKLCDPYFAEGFPFAVTKSGSTLLFTQKDIREVQMAKAAIRAGIEVLEQRAGVSGGIPILLAGGFGQGVNIEKAIAIGMLPKQETETIVPIGNSVLAGLHRFLFYERNGCTKAFEGAEQELEAIVEASEEIQLATDEAFCELFIDYIGIS